MRGLKNYTYENLLQALGHLELVNPDAYTAAASAGTNTVPKAKKAGQEDLNRAADAWMAHVARYARNVPSRLAQQLSDVANDDEDQSADAIASRIDAKLGALKNAVTRYAEPLWGTGQQAYGDALDANDVLLDWELGADQDHCDDCLSLADGGPYARGDIPTFPGAGDTACMSNCYCSVTAEPNSWAEAFGQAA